MNLNSNRQDNGNILLGMRECYNREGCYVCQAGGSSAVLSWISLFLSFVLHLFYA